LNCRGGGGGGGDAPGSVIYISECFALQRVFDALLHAHAGQPHAHRTYVKSFVVEIVHDNSKSVIFLPDEVVQRHNRILKIQIRGACKFGGKPSNHKSQSQATQCRRRHLTNRRREYQFFARKILEYPCALE
jgi:hypothetical protein